MCPHLSDSSAEFTLQDSLQGLELGRGQFTTPLKPIQQLNHSAYILNTENIKMCWLTHNYTF